ncbi:N-terminal acetyltransferase B complex catalytic subunit NAA20-like [Papaver somniferum]|uniref:N-terminal acetyltransferase B complex catalytic subunit NAA20-like n=1 Tax=Papaver somniferum TaxID=3469 RepID=UPI000E6FD654|nr:N-terminal acetyltransferase B complex catalytic subunit NAA20-like [Papaver somniferum]
MTTIRNFCCNDLLGITPILMDQFSSTQNGKPIDQAKMSWYLNQLAKLSRYFFVAESPGNRVTGYGTARIEGTNTTAKGCIVTHVAVYETSDMYDAVDCLNIMPSTNLTHIGLEEMLKGSRYVNHF